MTGLSSLKSSLNINQSRRQQNKRWEWLKLLRMQQVELYYFMVKHVGDHAYAADKSHMEINFI